MTAQEVIDKYKESMDIALEATKMHLQLTDEDEMLMVTIKLHRIQQEYEAKIEALPTPNHGN